MDFEHFRAIIVLLFMADAMGFSDENMEILKKKAYSHPTSAISHLDKWKKYLAEMPKRVSQKIPVNFIREMFPGTHNSDIYIPGKIKISIKAIYKSLLIKVNL